MLFQITQICFNGSDYGTPHSLTRIMTKNGAKMTQKRRNNDFKQLLSGTCQKSDIKSTP